jgi:hypothetical protein
LLVHADYDIVQYLADIVILHVFCGHNGEVLAIAHQLLGGYSQPDIPERLKWYTIHAGDVFF